MRGALFFITMSAFGLLTACSDDAVDGGPSGGNSSGGDDPGGSASQGASSEGGSSSSGNPSGGGGSGGGNTGKPCSPTCTGASLCDDSLACLCAPGWTFDGTSCVVEPISDPMTRTKEEVCGRLASATQLPATQWNPGAGGCDPGTVPFEGQVAALRYLNFYRWMIGVGPVQVDTTVAAAEQQCALMLNYYFGHDPGPDVMCYTPEGAAACGSSLIAGGYGLIGQVDGYALETGQNFIHHRNVLAVGRAGVWFGANGGSSDMHYGGAYPALPTDPAFVAHPGPGLQVMSKVPLTWWFVEAGTASTPPLDARVTIVATGEQKPMTRQHHFGDFSSFQTEGWVPEADTPYLVELIDDSAAVFGSFETTFINCP